METTCTCTLSLPRKKDLKQYLAHFGLLNVLVVGMVALAFIGRSTVPELRFSRTPATGIAAPTDPWISGSYGRTR